MKNEDDLNKELMNVRMPDGVIVRNVPKGTTQEEVMRRYNLHKTQQAWQAGAPERAVKAHEQAQANMPQYAGGPLQLIPGTVAGVESAFGLDPMHPISSIPQAVSGMARGIYQLMGPFSEERKAASGLWNNFLESIHAAERSRQEGDAFGFAQNFAKAYTIAKPVMETGAGVARGGAGTLADIGNLRETAAKIGRYATGQSVEAMEIPEAQKYAAAKAEAANRQWGKAYQKNIDAAAQHVKDVADAEAKAAAETEKNRLAYEKEAEQAAEKTRAAEEKFRTIDQPAAQQATAASREETAQAIENRRLAAEEASRAETTARSVTEGSIELGRRVDQLDDTLRQEGNSYYEPVREATAKDPGIAPSDELKKTPNEKTSEETRSLAASVNHAKTNILKGSPEKIAAFEEILRRAKTSDILQTDAAMTAPIPFDDLQALHSEVIDELVGGRGNLPADTYQALTYMEGRLRRSMEIIADRSGVGPALAKANSFWRSYRELVRDPGGLRKVLDAIGTKNKAEAFNELMRTKGDEVAMERLGRLQTTNKADTQAVLHLIRNLKAAEEATGKAPKVPPRPKPPTTTTAQPPPRYFPPEDVPAPVAPEEVPPPFFTPYELQPGKVEPFGTVEDYMRRRTAGTGAFGRGFLKAKLRDAGFLLGPLLGHPYFGAIGFLGEKGLGLLMQSERVQRLIAEPMEDQLRAADYLPEPEATQFRDNFQKVVEARKRAGNPIRVSPRWQPFLTRAITTGAVSAPPANRKEALERLGRNPAQPTAPPATTMRTTPSGEASARMRLPAAIPAPTAEQLAARRPVPRDDPRERQREDRRAKLKNPIDVMDSSTGITGQISASAWDPDRYVMRDYTEKPPARTGKPGPDDFVPDPSEFQPFVGGGGR